MSKNTTNVIQHNNSGHRWQIGKEVFKKCDTILLLLTRAVDVGKEKGNIMMAYQCHDAGVVEAVHRRLLFVTVSSFIRRLTLINCLIWNFSMAMPRWLLTCSLNSPSDLIHLSFWNEVCRIIERGTTSRRTLMAMVKVSISGHVNITTIT